MVVTNPWLSNDEGPQNDAFCRRFYMNNGERKIGDPQNKAAAITNPQRTVSSIKRYMVIVSAIER